MERRLAVNAIGVIGGLALSFLFGATAYAGSHEPATSTQELVNQNTSTSTPAEVQLKVEGYTLESAELDLCEAKAYFCNVPAPTVIKPNRGLVYPYGNEVLITGLSWNPTKVDLYIDGVYEGRVNMREHPTGVGNFWYRPSRAIPAGPHTLYTIALSLNEWDRSPRSTVTSFNVQQKFRPAPKPEPAPQPSPMPAEQPTEPETEGPATQTPASRILGFFFGGTTTATSTAAAMTVNTVIGLVILILILLFIMRLARGDSRRVDASAPHDQHLPFDEGPPPESG